MTECAPDGGSSVLWITREEKNSCKLDKHTETHEQHILTGMQQKRKTQEHSTHARTHAHTSLPLPLPSCKLLPPRTALAVAPPSTTASPPTSVSPSKRSKRVWEMGHPSPRYTADEDLPSIIDGTAIAGTSNSPEGKVPEQALQGRHTTHPLLRTQKE